MVVVPQPLDFACVQIRYSVEQNTAQSRVQIHPAIPRDHFRPLILDIPTILAPRGCDALAHHFAYVQIRYSVQQNTAQSRVQIHLATPRDHFRPPICIFLQSLLRENAIQLLTIPALGAKIWEFNQHFLHQFSWGTASQATPHGRCPGVIFVSQWPPICSPLDPRAGGGASASETRAASEVPGFEPGRAVTRTSDMTTVPLRPPGCGNQVFYSIESIALRLRSPTCLLS